MSGAPTSNQIHFRFRSDTGSVNGTPTWLAAEDTNITLTNSSVPFRLRIGVQNTGTAGQQIQKLGWSKNGGSYTTMASATTGVVGNSSASSDTTPTAITTGNFVLTAMSGDKVAGTYNEINDVGILLSSLKNIETEWGLSLVTADFTNGDTIDFRLFGTSTASAMTSYDVTPRITIGTGTTNNIMGQIVL